MSSFPAEEKLYISFLLFFCVESIAHLCAHLTPEFLTADFHQKHFPLVDKTLLSAAVPHFDFKIASHSFNYLLILKTKQKIKIKTITTAFIVENSSKVIKG